MGTTRAQGGSGGPSPAGGPGQVSVATPGWGERSRSSYLGGMGTWGLRAELTAGASGKVQDKTGLARMEKELLEATGL